MAKVFFEAKGFSGNQPPKTSPQFFLPTEQSSKKNFFINLRATVTDTVSEVPFLKMCCFHLGTVGYVASRHHSNLSLFAFLSWDQLNE